MMSYRKVDAASIIFFCLKEDIAFWIKERSREAFENVIPESIFVIERM